MATTQMPQNLPRPQGRRTLLVSPDRYWVCFRLQRQVCLPSVQFSSRAVLTQGLPPSSEITIWTFEGDVVHSFSAHTSFVYSLCTFPNGDGASGGEDGSLRIWRGALTLPTSIGFRILSCSNLSRWGVPPDYSPSCDLSMVRLRDAQR